jgi:hypothetical protein
MPTKYRRIAVTEDPELAEALRRASGDLPGLSSAALVRELALRGSKTLPVDAGEERLARLIERTGARPAQGDIRKYLAKRERSQPVDPGDPYAVSDALQEQREERF